MRRFLLALACFLGMFSSSARAGDAEIAALRAVLAPGPLEVVLFDAEFLSAVPAAQISAAVEPLKATIGPVVTIEAKGGPSYAVETATHEMLADIVLDADGKIGGLRFSPPVAKAASIEDILKQLAAIAPQSAWLVTKDGATIYSSNADTPLAVGSAFKLGILKALKDEIDAGTRKWSDVVTLTAGDISLPSGVLQGWPVGSVLTLDTLADEMISISDNTAADTLLRVVGRDKVEAALGIAPVLTTRELFTLKADPELKARYLAADLQGRRAVLAEADARPVPKASEVMTPHDQGVEYEVPVSTLCRAIGEVGDLAVTQINPGVASKVQWARVSFKGGSEIGVLNFTTLATSPAGATYCVSATWNAPQAIDEAAAGAAYASLLSKLSKG